MSYIMAIDAGTTSTRSLIFSEQGDLIGSSQHEFTQYFPKPGWVEHDAQEIWQATREACYSALSKNHLLANNIKALGITNQRETTVIWHKKTGKPIHRAIVWQDRRTADYCQSLKSYEPLIQQKTGLLLDPYFSASKIQWLLDNVPNARTLAENNELAFGTIDSYLLWQLTDGKVHATDATNASRTAIFNIKTQQWDDELLAIFNIPRQILPTVCDSSFYFGEVSQPIFGASIPITAMIGDQQAATVGQACFQPGMMKSTYGTGCFMMLNTGENCLQSKSRLLSTVAYRLNGKTTYALEGSIFMAGAIVQWLRDNLGIIHSAHEVEQLATQVNDNGGVTLVPAFTGMGAPYWDPYAKAAILGLSRDSNKHHIARAALEAVVYQSKDLLLAMEQEGGAKPDVIRVDGGMVVNHWLLQFLADMLAVKVERPAVIETTALGAAYFAGLQIGCYQSLDHIAKLWQSQQTFVNKMQSAQRDSYYQQWLTAVGKIVNHNK